MRTDISSIKEAIDYAPHRSLKLALASIYNALIEFEERIMKLEQSIKEKE